MRRFEIFDVSCQRCRQPQEPVSFTGLCHGCRSAMFSVNIERAASGWGSYEFEDFIRGTGSDGPADPYWFSQDFLTCTGVSGLEIAEFCGASLEDRRRLYIAWKRRELEAALAPDQKVCGRCHVIYKAYANEWNPQGFCSRSCESAAITSQRTSTGQH